jgi:hypothetical protein
MAQQAAPTPAQAPVISVDFPGGSLRELIDAMRRIDPRLNITASSLAQDVKLPEMAIKGAAVINVLTAAAAVAPPDYAVMCNASQGPGEPVYMVMVQGRQQQQMGQGMAPAQLREVRVFSLRSLIEAQPADGKDRPIALPVETVLSALESGVRMGAREDAELKYHRDSGLLFVNGQAQQINVVREVLQNLEQDQKEARKLLQNERIQKDQAAQRQKAEAAGDNKVDKK